VEAYQARGPRLARALQAHRLWHRDAAAAWRNWLRRPRMGAGPAVRFFSGSLQAGATPHSAVSACSEGGEIGGGWPPTLLKRGFSSCLGLLFKRKRCGTQRRWSTMLGGRPKQNLITTSVASPDAMENCRFQRKVVRAGYDLMGTAAFEISKSYGCTYAGNRGRSIHGIRCHHGRYGPDRETCRVWRFVSLSAVLMQMLVLCLEDAPMILLLQYQPNRRRSEMCR